MFELARVIVLYVLAVMFVAFAVFAMAVLLYYQKQKMKLFADEQKKHEQVVKQKYADDKAQTDWCVAYLNEKQLHQDDLKELYEVKCQLIALKEDYDQLVELCTKTKLTKGGVKIAN